MVFSFWFLVFGNATGARLFECGYAGFWGTGYLRVLGSQVVGQAARRCRRWWQGVRGAELDFWGCGGAGGAGGMKGQRGGKGNAPQQVLGGVSLSFQQTWSGLIFATRLLRRSLPETIVDQLPTPLLSLVALLTACTR